MSKRNRKLAHVDVVDESVIDDIQPMEPEVIMDVEEVQSGRRTIVPIELSSEELGEFEQLVSKSAKIRWLAAAGYTVGQIARYMGILNQHAYNVLKTPLKRPVKVVD